MEDTKSAILAAALRQGDPAEDEDIEKRAAVVRRGRPAVGRDGAGGDHAIVLKDGRAFKPTTRWTPRAKPPAVSK